MTEFDAEAGRAAYAVVAPILDSYLPEEISKRTGRIDFAIIHALRVAEAIETQDLTKQFQRLAGLEMNYIENLRPLAWAAWHCSVQLEAAAAAEKIGRLDRTLLERATERRTRMLNVLEYHLGDEPAVARELTAIRAGSGYTDLASDLSRLAQLSEARAADLVTDRKHYVATDARDARSDAQAILQGLAVAETDAVAHWRDQLDRCWTALLEAYGELRAAAQWLWRHEPQILALFESLYAVTRPARRGRTRAPRESGIDASTEPVTPDEDAANPTSPQGVGPSSVATA